MKKIIGLLVAGFALSGLMAAVADADTIYPISFYVYNAVDINPVVSIGRFTSYDNDIKVDFYTTGHQPATQPCYSTTVSAGEMSGRISVPDTDECTGTNSKVVVTLSNGASATLFANNGSVTFDSSTIVAPITSVLLNASVKTQPVIDPTKPFAPGVLQVTDAPGLPH